MECPRCHSQNPDDTRFCGMCATQMQESGKTVVSPIGSHVSTGAELASGSTFAGRYQIIEELGKGGMGKVYKVWDTDVEEKVALKLLNPQTAGDEKTIERFRNELKLARQISHRNVCRMHDLGREEGTYYITMEYVPGEDLKSSIRRMGPLSIGKALSVAKQVCRGLAEAHRLGVVHRDLKPHNIMVDREGNARIMDFGIARSLRAKGITDTGVIIGTLEYMSVEQVEGGEVDERSDIYSLGVILYEMVTGRVPFDGDTPLSIAVKHTNTPAPDPRELNDQIPDDLSRVILRCMEKDKESRYQSAEELLTEMSKVEKGISSTTMKGPQREPTTSREITVSFSPRRVLIPCLILSLMLVASLIAWRVISHEPAVNASPAKPSLAVLHFKNNSGDPSLDYWRIGLPELITADLRQSRYLRVLSGDRLSGSVTKLSLAEKGEYSSADLREIATRGRVEHVLTGGIFSSGPNLVITAVLQNPHTGLVISSRRMECRHPKDVPVKIDELTRRMKSDLNLSPDQVSKDIDQNLAEIITGSDEAYRFYIQGRMNYFDGGPPDQTIQLMQNALALDPHFAMAYRTLAGAYNELGSISEAWRCLSKAVEQKDRLSVREYYLAQGELYSMSEQTEQKAMEAYNHLLKIYPEDAEANFNLGFLLSSDLERWNEAAERFEVLIQNQAASVDPYVYQAEAYMAMGKYDLARDVLRRCLTSFPDEVWLKERICFVDLCQNRLNSALRETQKALSSDPFCVRPSFVGDLHYCGGDWAGAETEYRKNLDAGKLDSRCDARLKMGALCLSQAKFDEAAAQFRQATVSAEEAEDPGREMQSHLWLARLYLAGARPNEAMEEWKPAWNAAPEAGSHLAVLLHLKGLVLLQMKSTEKAEGVADQLKKTIQTGNNKRLMRYHHHLTGMIELEKGNTSEAISHFQAALSLLPFQHSESEDQAQFIYPLAVAFYQMGDLEKAKEQFKKVTCLTTGRLFFGDLYARSFYWLGRIYQEKGWNQEAERHYARFLQLWAEHDLGIPEPEDAQSRLAELKGGT